MNTQANHIPKFFLIVGIFVFSLSSNALAQEVTIMLPGNVPMTLVKVPAGTFMMGSPEGERGNIFNNEFQHQVTLTQDYYMGKTEVTQQQWEAVMGTPMPTSCGTPAVGDDYPVYCITWDDMAGPGGFIEKLNQQQTVGEFRLPSEAEWENGARAGTTTRFSHGDVLQCGDDCEACAEHDPSMWFCGNDTTSGPKPVGTLLANAFGLHDMHGNMWELVNDRYADDYGSGFGEPATDPTGGTGSGDIVFKSGGAVSEVNFARSAARLSGSPSQTNSEVGFRIAASNLEAVNPNINAGMNDVWVSDDAESQGLTFTVFEDQGLVFIAWFTYDTVAPGEGSTATFGALDQRWVSGVGVPSGNSVTISVDLSTGGLFHSLDPIDVQESEYGTVTIVFLSCDEAILTYNFPSLGLSGQMTLRRIVPDNRALCETRAAS